LILANAAVFLLQGIWEEPILSRFALWPLGRFALPELHAVVGFHWWQLVTSAFLHANLTHLFLNMFALFMFGRDVEQVLGGRRYLAVYAAAVLSAALVQLFVVSFTVPASDPPYPTVGASGGVFGVLLAFGMLFPRRRVMLVFPPIPMPAWFLVFAYALIELASGVLGEAGIAHFAHLGGMLGAYLMLRVYRRDATSHPEGSND
jgi:membrane associated rhomboid family serine protease